MCEGHWQFYYPLDNDITAASPRPRHYKANKELYYVLTSMYRQQLSHPVCDSSPIALRVLNPIKHMIYVFGLLDKNVSYHTSPSDCVNVYVCVCVCVHACVDVHLL